jgi:hypothetical protein
MSTESLPNVVTIAPKEETPSEKNERQLYQLVDTSAALIGGVDVAAKVMGFDRGDWRRTIDRKGRYLAVEHVMRFGARLMQHRSEAAQRIAVAMMQPFDMIAMPRVQMTAAEQARRYKQMLDAMSPACGVDLARKALETP